MASNRSETPKRTTETVASMWQELNEAEQTLMMGRLQQWFADIEKNNDPNNTGTTPSLATQFLSRFGLKNASEVFYFLKTAGGKEAVTMIARELMKKEDQIQLIREQNEEVLRKRQHIVFLLMGLIAEREALAKNVDQLFRLEIERHLTKDKHTEHKETISGHSQIEIIDAMISNYLMTIHALDVELNKLEEQLNQVEKELIAIEEEEEQIEAYHDELHTHIDILDKYLELPILSHPQEPPAAFMERRRTLLMQDLERYREQEALHRNTLSEDPNTQEMARNRISRHIRTIEHELHFHQAHLSQTAINYEELFRLALEQTRSKIQELKSQSTSGPLGAEIEGLQLREQGLVSALKVMRNKKILLNDKLEQVFDFSQARFIVKHEEAKCLIQKDDGSYALIPKDMDPKKLTQDQWEQAKLNFDQEKERIQTPRFNFMEKIQENLQKQIQRKEQHLTLREVLQAQRSEMHRAREKMGETLSFAQTKKATLLGNTPRLSQRVTPKSDPHPSYTQMIEKFESLVLKAPQKEDIEKARGVVKNLSISSESKGKLDELIEQVTPERVMEPQQRLQWLYSAKRIITDTSLAKPEVDPNKTIK
ncbi:MULTISPECIES: hypothetical protein [Legionella]|uniref:LidA long coiled-coil domain-containing protein n=1 Tax=Legionella resiliens TaxID=2905958 RepID=A0ABS8X2V8_9GAMM|nr:MULTISPECIES: hypothetical protein [unclassified Legionella]MCE0723156.1 hypothetical protein [Legionella sp. 9fVS26]MCE3532309.1 hypothetical protein [Legionella sp. 8cVS16]QLZ68440.1 hypothetical protein FOLKNPGA_01218 [Legionella sp. PC1000]